MRYITFVDQNTAVKPGIIAGYVATLQKQMDMHFSPVWNIWFKLSYDTRPPLEGKEAIYLLDTTDQADALAYHTLDNGDTPVGYVFTKTVLEDMALVPVVMGHELMEQGADPFVNLIVEGTWLGAKALFGFENVDPVQGSWYKIGSTPVANFVSPKYFQEGYKAQAYDYMGILKAPLSLAPAGYLSYATEIGNWQQAVSAGHTTSPSGKKITVASPPYSRYHRVMRRIHRCVLKP